MKDDDFDLTTALEKAAFVQRGDIWTVGRHKLMCGDATSAEDVSALMGDTKANLILTDPPYGVSFKSASGLTIQNDSMKNEEFYTFLLSSFQRMAENLEKGGSAYVFHADTEGLNFRKAFIDAGFHLAGCCIWVKDSLVLGRSDYQWQHEPVLYGFMQNGKHKWYSDRKQTTIGISISRNETQIIRRVSRSTCLVIPSATPHRRTVWSSTPLAAAVLL